MKVVLLISIALSINIGLCDSYEFAKVGERTGTNRKEKGIAFQRSPASSQVFIRTRRSSNGVRIGGLPHNHTLCPNSTVYYCPDSSECRWNDDSETWRCITRGQVFTNYRRTQWDPRSGRRFYPDRQHSTSNGGESQSSCPPGYRRQESGTCKDINECLDRCNGAHETCSNYPGSYRCWCDHGFKRKDGECLDRDECEDLSKACGIGLCVNLPGSYRCDCPPGYEEQGYRRCRDINECQVGNPCVDDEICFNSWGGHSCDRLHDCPRGYHQSRSEDGSSTICTFSGSPNATKTADVITYRKLLVDSRNVGGRSLARLSFRNYDSEYKHRLSAIITEGSENFWYRVISGAIGSDHLEIAIYNRSPFTIGEKRTVILRISDEPKRKIYQSGRYWHDLRRGRGEPPAVTQDLHITLVPDSHE